MLHRAARNAYSWWWASHVRTKQSKWLDQNLQDMEEKVEYILKIIDEDGDTFAKRAEMYYRKRPELINFVEDSFRGYRALAERYDHLSKELQSANRTIATVCPESVHLSMEDEDFDGENLPMTTASPLDKFNPHSKRPPPVPGMSISKNPGVAKKNGKMPSRLMSRKGLLKLDGNDAAATTTPVSGLSKTEALKKIDKLQKEILALQTEKEFVKCSYESGLEKYWNFEKQITELQAEVSNLQDEFGIGTVIEDDEARALMTATALKSCQETLARLREKQEQSAEEARVEFQKIQEAREKFRNLKQKFESGQSYEEEGLQEKKATSILTEDNNDVDEQCHQNVEELRKRIKEELQVNLGTSLTMPELAEKVDELVETIISLESAVSSQCAHVKRLRSETNELQTHFRSLEEEKVSLVEDSHGMCIKIRDLEEKLQRVQSLNQSIKEKSNRLQTNFIEVGCNFDDLSEKLLVVKPDEEAANTSSLGLSQAASNKDLLSNQNKTQLHANQEELFGETKDAIDPGYSSPIMKDTALQLEEIKHNLQNSSTSEKDKDERIFNGPTTDVRAYSYNHSLLTEVEANIDEPGFSNSKNHRESYLFNGPEGDILDVHEEISGNNRDKVVAGQRMQMEGEIIAHNSIQSAAQNHSRSSGKENSGDQSTLSFFGNSRAMQLENNDVHGNPSAAKSSNDSRDPGFSNQLNNLPHLPGGNTSGGILLRDSNAHERLSAPESGGDMKTAEDPKKSSLSDQERGQDLKQQNGYETMEHEFDRDHDDLGVEEDDQPNWKELFVRDLDDREKLLLQEYTSILGNYKDAKKKLNEMEKKKRASLFQYCIQIKVLKSANGSKDAKIKSLEKKLNLVQENHDATLDSRDSGTIASFHAHDDESVIADEKALPDVPHDSDSTSDSIDAADGSTVPDQPKISFLEDEGGIKVINVDKPYNLSIVEERIRTDIDELLEANIEFWMKFSTSFNQVQKFQTSVEDLQAELAKVREAHRKNGNTNRQSLISDIRPIYRHLSEIQTELTLWQDQNALLNDDLKNRLSSLSGIQGEIKRLSNAGCGVEETELSEYQAARFQGEILHMMQENNKIAAELHSGVKRVKIILIEIERTLKVLDVEFGVSTSKQQTRSTSTRSRIPLRSFLFGVKLKKQKPSIFSCISPSLQKQYSDLAAVHI